MRREPCHQQQHSVYPLLCPLGTLSPPVSPMLLCPLGLAFYFLICSRPGAETQPVPHHGYLGSLSFPAQRRTWQNGASGICSSGILRSSHQGGLGKREATINSHLPSLCYYMKEARNTIGSKQIPSALCGHQGNDTFHTVRH